MPTYRNIKTGKTASFDKKKPRLERSDRWVEVKDETKKARPTKKANGPKAEGSKAEGSKAEGSKAEGETTEGTAPGA